MINDRLDRQEREKLKEEIIQKIIPRVNVVLNNSLKTVK